MKIVWDMENHVFLQGVRNSQRRQKLSLKLRDVYDIELYIVKPSTAGGRAFDVVDAPVGYAPKMVIKKRSEFDESDKDLVRQDVWVQGADADGDTYYNAEVSLNTQDLITAVGESDNLAVVMEFTLQSLDLKNRDSSELAVTVVKDAYRPDNDVPTAQALYPFGEHYTIDGAQGVRIFYADGSTALDMNERDGIVS